MDEAAIRRRVGIRRDETIMPRQLMHIVQTVTDNDSIEVRVLPFREGDAYVGMLTGAFTLLEFNGVLPELLHLEDGASETTLVGDDPRISDRRAEFEQILDVTMSATDSLVHQGCCRRNGMTDQDCCVAVSLHSGRSRSTFMSQQPSSNKTGGPEWYESAAGLPPLYDLRLSGYSQL